MNGIAFGFILLLITMAITCFELGPASRRPKPCNQKIWKGGTHQFHRGPIRDHVLRGKDYRNQSTRSYLTCAGICLQEDACKSFNFYQDDRRCQLNSAVYSEDKSDLQPSSGCLYFDEEVHGECQEIVTSTYSSYTFPFPPLNSSQTFRVDFAAKGESGARVALSEHANEHNYYDIVICSGPRSLIRKDRFTDEYYKEVPTPDDLVTEYEYRRFWISYDEGTIQVGKGGEFEPFMQWHDVTRKVPVSYVGIRAYNYPTSWIFYTFCFE